jgi:hypothetical protein
MWKLFAYGTVACLAVVSAAVMSQAQASSFGFKGKMEVGVIQLGYIPASKSLKVRMQPAASAAPIVEYESADPQDIDRLLRLAELKSQGATLTMELDGGKVKMIDVAVGGRLLATED